MATKKITPAAKKAAPAKTVAPKAVKEIKTAVKSIESAIKVIDKKTPAPAKKAVVSNINKDFGKGQGQKNGPKDHDFKKVAAKATAERKAAKAAAVAPVVLKGRTAPDMMLDVAPAAKPVAKKVTAAPSKKKPAPAPTPRKPVASAQDRINRDLLDVITHDQVPNAYPANSFQPSRSTQLRPEKAPAVDNKKISLSQALNAPREEKKPAGFNFSLRK